MQAKVSGAAPPAVGSRALPAEGEGEGALAAAAAAAEGALAAAKAVEEAAKQEELNHLNPLIRSLTRNHSLAIASFLNTNDADQLDPLCKNVNKASKFNEGVLELDLSNRKNLNSQEIIEILEKYTNIKHLNLSNTNVDDTFLEEIKNKCKNLKTLNLSGCYGVTNVSALAGCASLHTLNLSNTNVDNEALNKLSNSESLKNSLHTLNLSYCRGVTDVSALGKCASLHTLDLSFCSGVTELGALAGCASLHTLNLSNTNVDDKDLNKLANSESLKNSLHTLDLRGCRGVTGVSALDNPNLTIYY